MHIIHTLHIYIEQYRIFIKEFNNRFCVGVYLRSVGFVEKRNIEKIC